MTERDAEIPQFAAESRQHWRDWLEANHAQAQGIWLVYYKKSTGKQRLTYDEAVEEALCFGWIDSRELGLDAERYRQLFTPRKPGSAWSRSNKERAARLIAAGRMTPAGQAKIDAAQQDGSWEALDAAEALAIPPDLQAALDAHPAAAHGFQAFRPAWRKQLLLWLASAKRPQTRAKRIAAIVDSSAEGRNPLQD